MRGHPLSALTLVLAAVGPAVAQEPVRSRPPLGPVPELDFPAPKRVTLPNGLRLVVVEKHNVPLVQVNVLIGAGSVYEDDARLGLASLVADLLDEGAAGRSALEIADAFESLGARFSSDADLHTAQISLRVPVGRLDGALGLAADVIQRPDFAAAELERKRAERITALIRSHDEPNAIASVLFEQVLFGSAHAYGRSSLGTEQTLSAIDAESVRAFHRRLYRPNNATVVVVGAIDTESALIAVQSAFGRWERADVPTVSLPAAPVRSARTVYLVDKPGAAQSVIAVGSVAVPRATPDYAVLEVLNTVLGGSFTSRLNQNLREEKGYTYGASSDFDYRLFPGPFRAGAAVQTDATAPALREFMRELEAIRAPIPEDELSRARNFLAMRYPAGFQSVAAVAARVGELVEYELPDDTFDRYVGDVLGVSAAAALGAARKYVRPDDVAIVVVGDRARVEAGIRELGLGEVRVLSVEDVLGPVPVRTGT